LDDTLAVINYRPPLIIRTDEPILHHRGTQFLRTHDCHTIIPDQIRAQLKHHVLLCLSKSTTVIISGILISTTFCLE